MAEQDLIAAANRIMEAFNEGDWQRFSTLLTPDMRYEEIGTERSLEGVDAYVHLCQQWKETFRDVRGTVRNAIATGNTVAEELIWEGTHTGPFDAFGIGGAVQPSGMQVEVRGTMWLAFQGDKCQAIRHYLDVASLVRQVNRISYRAGTG